MSSFECVYFVVHHGLASKILRFARNHGIFGGTIFYGTGTVKNFWLEVFELSHAEKEILVMAAQPGYAVRLMKLLYNELEMEKQNHGIVFSVPALSFTGGIHETDLKEDVEEVESMYHLITVVVNKGDAETALEAAQEAGAQGGTIINARGAGRNETSRLFLMDIEPEKEILMMIVKKEDSQAITEAVSRKMHMEEQGRGIMFVQEVSRAYGLYHKGK